MTDAARPLILWGARGHAKVLAEFAVAAGFEPVVVFDSDPDMVQSPLPGVGLHTGRQAFDRWVREWNGAPLWGIAAIGGARGEARLELHGLFRQRGIGVPTLVHPRGFVAATAVLGEGTQVLVNAIAGAGSTLGRACIVNTAASIDHECTLEDGVHIGPGARLAGCVQVGRCAFVGTGAVVLPRIRIGANAIVGAGAVVTRDVPDGVVVYGNPARVVRVLENAK